MFRSRVLSANHAIPSTLLVAIETDVVTGGGVTRMLPVQMDLNPV